MEPSTTAFGVWNGGRYVAFGRALNEARWLDLVRTAYDSGVRTFVTADVYGQGAAEQLLARALQDVPRDSYCLVGLIGHDFYAGTPPRHTGHARFTDPTLRTPGAFAAYLEMAVRHSLQRCRTDHFDVVMLHNPDAVGYTSQEVWTGLARLKWRGLTQRLGVAPGPANGFALDLIHCFENFGEHIDWALLILNPLEPWPTCEVLPAACKHGVSVMARVVECGGLFHDNLGEGHQFRPDDHRLHRPAGWIQEGVLKIARMRPIAEKHRMPLLHLASQWALAQPAVRSVVPTLMEELNPHCKPILQQLHELATLPSDIRLTAAEIAFIRRTGDNTGRLEPKGASPRHSGPCLADRWPLTPTLAAVARRWNVQPR
ncbi:MAG: aldo/keto reductase [Pedosphaera sp.]|nr:aldo/keto reductase [Pedosphaera sp.]